MDFVIRSDRQLADRSRVVQVRLPNDQLITVTLRWPRTTDTDLEAAVASNLSAGYVQRGRR